MRSARIWTMLILMTAFGLSLSSRAQAQSVHAWSTLWYDEGIDMAYGEGATEAHNSFGYGYFPQIEVDLYVPNMIWYAYDDRSYSSGDAYASTGWVDGGGPGTYSVQSNHSLNITVQDFYLMNEISWCCYEGSQWIESPGYDPLCYIIPGVVSLLGTMVSMTVDPPACAHPVHFRQAGVTQLADGNLRFNYAWSSNTGDPMDLAACSVGESVFYPNYPTSPYTWPLPMVSTTSNPFVVGPGPAMFGGMLDNNLPPTSFQEPYKAAGFQATQRLWWHCPCWENGAMQYFTSDIIITRRVFLDTDNFWKYQITKSGASNTVRLPGQ